MATLPESGRFNNSNKEISARSPISTLEFPTQIRKLAAVHPPQVEVEVAGNPEVGTVTVFKQIHTIYTENYRTLRKIGLHQAQIYKDLIDTLPHRHIFVEGLQNDFPDTSSYEFSAHCNRQLCPWRALWKSTNPAGCVSFVRSKFQNYDPQKPSTEQLLYLGALGAPVIFAITYTDVSLHKTTDAAFEARILSQQAELEKTEPRNSVLLRFHEVREVKALEEVDSFLIKHPAAKVDLVFGSWHNFLGAAKRYFRNAPVMIAHRWDQLTVQLGWQLSPNDLHQNN